MLADAVLIEIDVKQTEDFIDAIKHFAANEGWYLKISLGGQYEIDY